MEIDIELGKGKRGEVGAIMKLDNEVIAILLDNEDLVLLKYGTGKDWFHVDGGGFYSDYKEGKYKVLAYADEWKIVRK